jgi:hypothetical protein
MSNRITEKQLEAVCDLLNRELGRPMEPWSKTDDGYKANIGNFHISHAYGGVSLHEMVTDGGGVNDVFSQGHCPKRELFSRIHAMLDGIQMQKENSAA